MGRRDGQVDDDFDVRVVEDGGDVSSVRYLVLGRLLPGGLGEEVADGEHFGVGEVGEVLQVGVADRSGANHSDANRLTHQEAASASRNSRLARTASNRSVLESSNSKTRKASGAAAMMSNTGSTPDPTATCLLVSRVPSPSFRCSAATRSPRRFSRAGTSAPP